MTLLLLAGSGEAPAIAEGLSRRGIACAVWRAPGARLAADWPVPVATGDLGRCLSDPALTAVLDASHPFATDISGQAARACAARGVPYCLLRRPEWPRLPGDRWTPIASEADAPAHIPAGATIFLATGREGLAHFADRKDAYIYCRQIGAPDGPFPLANGAYLIQQPPFAVEEEIALFERLEIDWLVLRNTGSTRAVTKLLAARHLGLNVAMIDRPAAPPGIRCAATTKEALEWAAAL
ncbi:precorrin-6A/cobalt-precorrin-6A reductase [Pelagivirga sediminicola]|uniref:precorrin-6A/cobalt-precorrin-6A reductase n=1 Tax=Pelagivirga sediminicola TaxID=2170575 RepID=UPI0014036965|nr:precorrin-6A/cobalt-precorrin-6A reductase [Pelagivirga sediminicola]